ncbi:molybdate ABC transporter substrate-binding protein [Roseibium sediminicola]|uniref:Molybdate ABC transporter substrate-binding protein n=1 Tax=Roseibium sediminicola TaxID=2933272 RepID=A0ABT0H3C8_9HYPH|nr:molybdate ABC transporter substrate-binding protein [Roseibium sp. CAU 1639]MCK7615610.1 molybdate ABC transporter substrate-binding protein [Roseibium sp. CAU 1639]
MFRRLLLVVVLTLTALTPARAEQPLTVFAAASLREAMEAIGKAFEAETGTDVVFSFAGTGTLARQIEAGAPAAVFLSADEAWMNYVRDAGAVEANTIRGFASNTLVLVGPKGSAPLTPSPDGLSERLGGHRLAMADPDTVPAGRYGKAALEGFGLWSAVSGSVAPMENVRVALTAVARGDTPLGLVYATDARVEPGVSVLFEFPQSNHPPIRYLAALTGEGDQETASEFLSFLSGPDARQILRSFGFVADNG